MKKNKLVDYDKSKRLRDYRVMAQYAEVAEILLMGEEFGAIPTHEVEISVLLRSPNEHGTVDRANNWNSKVDKYLRDSYTTSTVIRNLFYQSQ